MRGRKKLLRFRVALVLLGVVIAVAQSREASALPALDAYWRALLTGDTRGHIHQCGCEQGQFGGRWRRATPLARTRKPGDLLDLRNMIEGDRPHDPLRLKYVLEGLNHLEFDYLVPGTSARPSSARHSRGRPKVHLREPRARCAGLIRKAWRHRWDSC